MACNPTSGITLDCLDNMGGIKEVWILGGTVSSYTLNGSDEITAIGGTGTFYSYELPKDTGSWTETTTVSATNGTVFYAGSLVIDFHKLDSTKRNQFKLIAKNPNLKVVVQDSNDTYWCLGFGRGAQMVTNVATTGVAAGDANKYTVTISTSEPSPAYAIGGTATLSSVCSGITVQ